MLMIVTIITVFVIGLIVTTYNVKEYFLSISTYDFLGNSIMILVHNLPGVFCDNVYGSTVNGALWTIPVEFICYIFAYAYTKILKKYDKEKIAKVSYAFLIFLFVILYVFKSKLGIIYQFAIPFIMFSTGIVTCWLKDKILISKKIFCADLLLFVIMFYFVDATIATILFLPYLLIYLMYGTKTNNKFKKVEILGDMSYCMYLIGFTVQQCTVYYFGGSMNPILNAIISVPIDIVISFILYWFIERRILNMSFTKKAN